MAAPRKKKQSEEEHENIERWLLTYADMITLLMVLFIVLFSIGQLDLKKFEQLREGLTESFGTPAPIISSEAGGRQGVLDGGHAPTGEEFDPEAALEAQATLASQIAQERAEERLLVETQEIIQGTLNGQGLGSQVTYRLEARGLVLNVVTDQVLFDTGKADLKPDGLVVLDGVAQALKDLPNKIGIEGHTDNRPLNGGFPYPTNWELSTGRAMSVLRYFVEHHGLDPNRVSGAGYGEFRPLVPNDTAEHQSQNRRVEIVVLSTAQEARDRILAEAQQEGTP
jgi:chemotaxis protein MotB